MSTSFWSFSSWGSFFGVVGRALGPFRGPPQRIGGQILSSSSSDGTVIDEVTALKVAAVIACVRLVATGIASTSAGLYTRSWDARRSRYVFTRAHDHPLERVLLAEPNDFQTQYEFIEWIVMQGMLKGNAYVPLIRNTRRQVTQCLPVAAERVRVILDTTFKRSYELAQLGGAILSMPAEQMLHVRNLSFDAQVGLDTLALAADFIQLSRTLEAAHGEGGKRASRIDGYISSENVLKPEEAIAIRDAFAERFGPGKPGGIAVLDKKMDFKSISFSARDMQLVEQREHAVRDVARGMGVIPAMIGVKDEASSYNSTEQLRLQHKAQTLGPWWNRIEQAIKRDVIGYDGNNADLYFRFDRHDTTDVAAKEQADRLAVLVNAGIITPNEARAVLGLSPYSEEDEAADKLRMPLNMQTGLEAPDNVDQAAERGRTPQVRQSLPADDE